MISSSMEERRRDTLHLEIGTSTAQHLWRQNPGSSCVDATIIKKNDEKDAKREEMWKRE